MNLPLHPKSEARIPNLETHSIGSFVFRFSVFVLFLSAIALATADAANDYNWRLIVPPLTGDVEQVQLDPSQWSLTLTNFPNGVRRGSLEFIGSGGGGGTNTVLIAEPGILLTPQGAGTNGIGADFSLVISNQMTDVQLNGGPVVSTGDTTDFYPRASNPAGYLTASTGLTAVPPLSNVVAAGNITGSGIVFSATSASNLSHSARFVDLNGDTNELRTLNNAFAAINANTQTTNTLAYIDKAQVISQPQTFTASTAVGNTFTQYNGNAGFAASVGIATNLAVGGNLSIGGSLTSGNLSGGTGYQAANLSGAIATNQLAPFSANTGTIGGPGSSLVVHLNSAGIPDGWSTVAGGTAGTATNAVTAIENANTATWYNNVNGLIFTNFSDFSSNGSTNTIGFNNAPFETVELFQGGTNFVLHGATLSFTNATTQGLTIALTNDGTLTVGGSISNLATAGTPTSLSYSHGTTDSGSGTGTLTMNSLGGDLDIQLSTNNTGQAAYFSMDSKTSFTLKRDTGAGVYTKEFKMGLNLDQEAVWEVTPSLGNPGFTWDFVPPHMAVMLSLGHAWAASGYSTMAGAANFIVDEMDNESKDNHGWYVGNNTNFPAIWVKAGGYAAVSATGAVMNSDWINIGVASSTNGTIKAAFIGVASNEDFLAVWPSLAMSQNGTNGYVWTSGTGYNGPMQYSTNSTDSLQFGTNRFAGWLFGHNGTFGANYTNMIALLARDETNGLQVLSVSTNNGGAVWLGPTNNLQHILVAGGLSTNISVSGSTFYYTNGLLQGVTTP